MFGFTNDTPSVSPAENPVNENLMFDSENPVNPSSYVPNVAYFEAVSATSNVVTSISKPINQI